jgi:AraC-like DNA-binding protein
VKHIELFHRDHFEYRYYRKLARRSLSRFIDFFWETDFDQLWEDYPQGFSDILYPNLGYTYMLNLGTPFMIQLEDKVFDLRSDSFIPRYKNLAAHHVPGNKVFGIKFKVSPVVFEKKINFAEYREYIFPLAYLIDPSVVQQIKSVNTFSERVDIISDYYASLIRKYTGSLKYIDIVTDVLQDAYENNLFTNSIELFAQKYKVSSRTLQRYFEAATGINTKKALQMMKVRKAIAAFIESPEKFDGAPFGYYDHSHFYKHITQFLKSHPVAGITSHLELLKGSNTKVNY